MKLLPTKLMLGPVILIALGRFACAQTLTAVNQPAGAMSAAGERSDTRSATRDELEQLRGEVTAQRQTIEELKAMVQRLASTSDEHPNAIQEVRMIPATLQTIAETDKKTSEKKPRENFEWTVGGAKLQIYGHGDVSYDYVTNGITPAAMLANGVSPTDVARANNGWMGQVSSNLSYLGFRGSRRLNHYLTGVFQIETEVSFADNPGTTSDGQNKFSLGGRDTYVGMQGPWGAVKIGRENAPYKKASSPLDPFLNTIGDSRSIMGNSGGDNRAEFMTRIPHAIWYESPGYKGFSASLLFSPGQNRSADNSAYARGEPNCSGGNGLYTLSSQNRGSSNEAANLNSLSAAAGLPLDPCADGSWGNVTSALVAYKGYGLNAFVAYEHHSQVNRAGDDPTFVGIADEAAWKFGTQYTLKKTGTTGNFIYEHIKRYAPTNPAWNERSRPLATWAAITQKFTKKDDLNLGWAHAGSTPGDPAFGAAGAPLNTIDNASNLYDIGVKHHFTNKMSAYFVYTEQKNHRDAHYDLGAVGHGVTVDDHIFTGAPIQYFGQKLQGVSGGMTYDF